MAQDERPYLRKELLEYCDHVPPRVNDGSHDMAVKFKAEVLACRKLANKVTASESELRSAISRMHGWW